MVKLIIELGVVNQYRQLYASDGEKVFEIFKEYSNLDREAFWVIPLTQKNEVIDICLVSIGSLTEATVHPREVFKPLIIRSAARCILVHNHPSGDVTPSVKDLALTTKLQKCGEFLDIPIIDHVIVSSGRVTTYYSFCEMRIL